MMLLVSALFTSVAINSCLCILFFVLYSVLRKQPSNSVLYTLRFVSERTQKLGMHFRITRYLPSSSWVRKAWELSEDELLLSCVLDAVVFICMLIFSLRVTGAIGIFVLLPVNCVGTQLEHFDITNLSNISLDFFSIANVNNGSKR